MAPSKSLLAFFLAVVALPKLKAWTTGEWHCHRLVPLSITSVVTPCTFPCLVIPPNTAHGQIVLRREMDGTPCKVTGSHPPAFQISRCRNGICQLPDLQLHLKRTKREDQLSRKRRGLVGSVKKKYKKRKEKRKKKKEEKKKRKAEAKKANS
ncbi:uncharacterized protein LOC119443919 [Dermacentor silvarum]|uniref:uncharacterized protein LOC119443919 n=1 Tax=Dermacentor silvarum TaxID=543639 RepID=UPI001896B9B8|nr:uncharacterized protein LOC119443919 [Dermacentor silvarum]